MPSPLEHRHRDTARVASAMALTAALACALPARATDIVVSASASGPCGRDVHTLEFPDLSAADVSAAISCADGGTSGSARVRADSLTASVGVSYAAQSGPFYPGGAGGSAALADDWSVVLPSSYTADYVTIPVTMSIEGSVSEFAPTVPGQPVLYDFQVQDTYAYTDTSSVRFEGSLDNSFDGLLQWSGSITVRNLVGAVSPINLRVNLDLTAGGSSGQVDLYNTAWLSLGLPEGSTVRNASGQTIQFLSAVPEPSSYALFAFGLLGLASSRAVSHRRRSNSSWW